MKYAIAIVAFKSYVFPVPGGPQTVLISLFCIEAICVKASN
jgi:hypothetical protein